MTPYHRWFQCCQKVLLYRRSSIRHSFTVFDAQSIHKTPITMTRFALLATCLIAVHPAHAGSTIGSDAGAAAVTSSHSATGLLLGKFSGKSAYDKIWSASTLYKDETNPVLQEFSLQGRLQIQYADGHLGDRHFDIEDYQKGGKDESVWGKHFEARRAFFGFKSKWFQNWKVEGQIDVDTDGLDGPGPSHTLYKDIYDLYVTYASSDAFNVSVGKQEIKLSRENDISSKELLTFERSLVTDMLHPGNLTGVWISGKGIKEHWIYELGLYSNDRVREFSNFDGGTLMLAKIGYDYSFASGLDSAITSIRYMHNSEPGYKCHDVDPNYAFPTSPKFSDAIALSNDIIQGRFGLTTDLIYGFGDSGLGQSDILAIHIIPSYFIADGLQLVGRIQLASSSEPNGLSLQSRYEAVPSTDRTGDGYASAYAGINYYLYGHKLKIMNGIEYSHLGGGDYDGYTFLSGIRFAF